MEEQLLTCAVCHYPIKEDFYFCPNCGKNLKPAAASTSVVKQIGIYALSILLPPLGLWPGIKYLMQDDGKAKKIGLIAIILTIISTLVTVWLTMGFVNQITQSITGPSSINQYENLGL